MKIRKISKVLWALGDTLRSNYHFSPPQHTTWSTQKEEGKREYFTLTDSSSCLSFHLATFVSLTQHHIILSLSISIPCPYSLTPSVPITSSNLSTYESFTSGGNCWILRERFDACYGLSMNFMPFISTRITMWTDTSLDTHPTRIPESWIWGFIWFMVALVPTF